MKLTRDEYLQAIGNKNHPNYPLAQAIRQKWAKNGGNVGSIDVTQDEINAFVPKPKKGKQAVEKVDKLSPADLDTLLADDHEQRGIIGRYKDKFKLMVLEQALVQVATDKDTSDEVKDQKIRDITLGAFGLKDMGDPKSIAGAARIFKRGLSVNSSTHYTDFIDKAGVYGKVDRSKARSAVVKAVRTKDKADIAALKERDEAREHRKKVEKYTSSTAHYLEMLTPHWLRWLKRAGNSVMGAAGTIASRGGKIAALEGLKVLLHTGDANNFYGDMAKYLPQGVQDTIIGIKKKLAERYGEESVKTWTKYATHIITGLETLTAFGVGEGSGFSDGVKGALTVLAGNKIIKIAKSLMSGVLKLVKGTVMAGLTMARGAKLGAVGGVAALGAVQQIYDMVDPKKVFAAYPEYDKEITEKVAKDTGKEAKDITNDDKLKWIVDKADTNPEIVKEYTEKAAGAKYKSVVSFLKGKTDAEGETVYPTVAPNYAPDGPKMSFVDNVMELSEPNPAYDNSPSPLDRGKPESGVSKLIGDMINAPKPTGNAPMSNAINPNSSRAQDDRLKEWLNPRNDPSWISGNYREWEKPVIESSKRKQMERMQQIDKAPPGVVIIHKHGDNNTIIQGGGNAPAAPAVKPPVGSASSVNPSMDWNIWGTPSLLP